jgi:hypothetical protein
VRRASRKLTVRPNPSLRLSINHNTILEEGERIAREFRTGPRETPDPSRWETEIVIRLADLPDRAV